MADGVPVPAAVEGIVDEAVIRRLIEHAGGTVGAVYGKKGKPHLRQKISGFNNAARRSVWVVLVDLDRDYDCAPPLRADWLPRQSPLLCFRVAVRAVEAWLLADAERLAAFLGVPGSAVPANPEELDDPKAGLVNLARASRRRDVRRDMVPREGSRRRVGPAYCSRLVEFVKDRWRPGVAASRSDSLRRAVESLREFLQGV